MISEKDIRQNNCFRKIVLNMTDCISIDKLMESVGCRKYPARWKGLFEAAMKEYDTDGCPCFTTEFYDRLDARYGCFETTREYYIRAAKAAAGDEALGRFVVLLITALRDKTYRSEDLAGFERPVTPPGKDPDAYEMATAFVLVALFEDGADELRRRGVPDEYIRTVLKYAAGGIKSYIRRHNGALGYDILWWGLLYTQCELFPIVRLEMQFNVNWSFCVTVFRNADGQSVPLANGMPVHSSGRYLDPADTEDTEGSWTAEIEETDSAWIGHSFGADGLVKKETTVLPKSEWQIALKAGDPVIDVHIPASDPFTPELIEHSFEETRRFASEHFPDYKYRAFICHSWLMSAQLDALLGEDSNIVKFSRRFRRMTKKSHGDDVFSFVFNGIDRNTDPHLLPENTRLERALKSLYVSGGALYEMYGYILSE